MKTTEKPTKTSDPAAIQVTQVVPQGQVSPLLSLPGNGMAQLRSDALWLWAGTPLEVKKKLPLSQPCGMGLLADGSLLAIEKPPQLAGNVRLHRLSVSGEPLQVLEDHLPVPFDGRMHIEAGEPDGFLTAFRDRSTVLREYRLDTKLGIVLRRSLELSVPQALPTLVRFPSGALAWYDPSTQIISVRPTGQLEASRLGTVPHPIGFLASGPSADQLWASGPAGELYLLVLSPTLRVVQTVSTGLPHVFHLSARGDQVAVLGLHSLPSPGHGWTVALFDATGKERWHQSLLSPSGNFGFQDRYVALTESAVVVGGSVDLMAWRRTDGQLIPVSETISATAK